jgi:CO/xanthine dehydrogenase Mo-binding subunit
VVAIVALVEIDRRSGKIWAKKCTVSHEYGPIINPGGSPGSRLMREALLM